MCGYFIKTRQCDIIVFMNIIETEGLNGTEIKGGPKELAIA